MFLVATRGKAENLFDRMGVWSRVRPPTRKLLSNVCSPFLPSGVGNRPTKKNKKIFWKGIDNSKRI